MNILKSAQLIDLAHMEIESCANEESYIMQEYCRRRIARMNKIINYLKIRNGRKHK